VPSPTATSDARFRAERSALRSATVELVHRADALASWRQECTGTKVRVDDRVYVLTARHCVSDLIDRNAVFPSLTRDVERMTAPDLHRPVDVTAVLEAGLGIRTVEGGGRVDTSSASPVTRVVAQWYPDVALLSVAGTNAFDAVPALVYRPGVRPGLEDGETASVGLPAAASGRRVLASGTYLGRVQNPSDPTQLLDLVGLHPGSPSGDACNYGASGSLAVISPGSFTGPLAVRNNVVNKAGSNGEDDPVFDRKDRKGMAEQLGRSLEGYATICGYAELTREVLEGLTSPGRSRAGGRK
jgi:hypothetical protein